MLIFADTEARSRCDLKKTGGRLYAHHPTTEVLCVVLCYERETGDEWVTWMAGDPAPDLPPVFDLVCHNGVGFDRHIWDRLGWQPPRRVIDTAELARVAGYPEASLDWLGSNLCAQPKDLEGSKITLALSRVSRAKKTFGQLPPVTPEILARVVQYCRRDVELMVRLYREHLSQWLDSDVEGLEAADRAVIDRGICFDRELAEMLLDADECLRDAALEAAGVEATAELSPAQLKNTLLGLGVTIDDCTADTIQGVLDECADHMRGVFGLPGAALDDLLAGAMRRKMRLDPVVRAAFLCTARQALSSIAAGKLRAGLLRCSNDGRLRDNTRYYGAHTGRWSGSGMQLQNMAAGADIDVEATIELLKQGRLEAVYLKEEKS